MDLEIDKVILKNPMNRKEPMDKERLQMIFKFVETLVAEVMGFGLSYLIILAMAGAFR